MPKGTEPAALLQHWELARTQEPDCRTVSCCEMFEDIFEQQHFGEDDTPIQKF